MWFISPIGRSVTTACHVGGVPAAIPTITRNDILARTLRSVNVPAMLEPPGLIIGYCKRPVGMTFVPWSGDFHGLGFHLPRYARPFAPF